MVTRLKLVLKILLAFAIGFLPKLAAMPLPSDAFTQHSAIMLVINPKTGRIVSANISAEQFYGYSQDKLTSLSIQDINQLTPQQVPSERSIAAAEGRNFFIFRHQLASGDVRTVEVYSAPFKDGQGDTQLLSIIKDISAQRGQQESLWHYQDNLEEQVQIQTKEIQQASRNQLILFVFICAVLAAFLLIVSKASLRLSREKRLSQAQQARLTAIFNAIDGYLLFTDRNGVVLSANKHVFADVAPHERVINYTLSHIFEQQFEWQKLPEGGSEHTLLIKGVKRQFLIDKQAVHEAEVSLGYLYVLKDITAQLIIEREQRLASTVFSTTSEGVLVSDKHNRIQMVNQAFSDITGFEQSQVIGQSPAILNSGQHGPSFFSQLYDSLQQRGHWEGEIWNRRKNGEIFPCWLQVSAVFDQQNDIDMYVALFNDITSRKHHEQLMWQQANFDNLTSLSNRRNFKEKFEGAVTQAKQNNTRLAVCFIDLDRFKAVNDTLGHHIGDLMLIEAAKRLEQSIRSSDTVARLGGDEFALLLPDIDSITTIEKIAQQVLQQLHRPFVLEGHEVFTSGSMGITLFPDDGDDTKVLLRNADSAMYKAKDHGRNCFQFFTAAMHEHAQARSQLESALHKALVNKEMYLVYQPILSLDGEQLGCEALLRWHSPQLGQVSPLEFIPICEEVGLILPVGEWVLNQACTQANHWRKTANKPFFITVNISSVQFKRQNVVELVKHALALSGLPAHSLTIEITETVLVDNSNKVLQQLKQLRNMGVELAIDDFGTGYSSLSYLKRFPLSKLKIDREFIRDLPEDKDDHAMVKAIVSMASNLGLKVVAEGVETSAQLQLLRQLKCDFSQGYLHNKPLSAAAFSDYLMSETEVKEVN